jgi:hypothetical protein
MSAPHSAASQRTPSPPPVAARPALPTGGFLTLVGVTEDGRRLRLADPHDPAGREFTVEIDARLRAALGVQPSTRPEHPVPKVETQMDSSMRPRDIQARIRSGETPESVAAAAQTTVDKVMPYAAPVLAEREHVAQRAQRSSIRRPAGEARTTLGDAVTTHLHTRNVDPEMVSWDAWRREDGRWAVTGRFSVQGRDGLAELTFDQPGNFVVLENDEARWLVGDLPDPVAAPEPTAEAEPTRRLSAVPRQDEHQLSLTDELGEAFEQALGMTDEPIEAFLDDQPGLDESALAAEAADAAALDDDPEPQHGDQDGGTEHEEPPRRAVKKTRGRASVPSWDEIMFGGGPTER